MEQLAFTGTQLILGLVAILVLIVATIFIMRNILSGKDPESLAEKYRNQESGAPLSARNKYPEADAFKLSGPIWNAGLAMALLGTVLAFNWTTYDEVVDIPEGALELEEDFEVEPPRTAEPPPPPPPPPPPVIEEVPEEEIEEEEEPVFEDQTLDVEEETPPPPPPPKKEAPPPPPPPPPPEPEVEEIFKVVEQMPRFPGCEDQGGDDKAKKACADKAMLQFIYKNIKYPAIARENGVAGTVVIQFVVEKDGSISGAKIVRDIGAQCGGEALRVVNLMNSQGKKWTPGKQRGKNVKVQFNLPVKFRLE